MIPPEHWFIFFCLLFHLYLYIDIVLFISPFKYRSYFFRYIMLKINIVVFLLLFIKIRVFELLTPARHDCQVI